jgi:hypothetical protein
LLLCNLARECIARDAWSCGSSIHRVPKLEHETVDRRPTGVAWEVVAWEVASNWKYPCSFPIVLLTLAKRFNHFLALGLDSRLESSIPRNRMVWIATLELRRLRPNTMDGYATTGLLAFPYSHCLLGRWLLCRLICVALSLSIVASDTPRQELPSQPSLHTHDQRTRPTPPPRGAPHSRCASAIQSCRSNICVNQPHSPQRRATSAHLATPPAAPMLHCHQKRHASTDDELPNPRGRHRYEP